MSWRRRASREERSGLEGGGKGEVARKRRTREGGGEEVGGWGERKGRGKERGGGRGEGREKKREGVMSGKVEDEGKKNPKSSLPPNMRAGPKTHNEKSVLDAPQEEEHNQKRGPGEKTKRGEKREGRTKKGGTGSCLGQKKVTKGQTIKDKHGLPKLPPRRKAGGGGEKVA